MDEIFRSDWSKEGLIAVLPLYILLINSMLYIAVVLTTLEQAVNVQTLHVTIQLKAL